MGVKDVDAAASPLEISSGWQLKHRGQADSAQVNAWGLEAGSSIDERLIHIPETYGGLIRFVRFSGAGHGQVRASDSNPWDSGGLWLFNTRTKDNESRSAALAKAGYPSPRGVHTFEFEFLTVKEVIHNGPDGMNVSMIEQLLPVIDPPEPYPLMSRAFNATIVCKDFKKTRRFFVDGLGFEPWIETTWHRENEGLNLVAPREDFDAMDSMDVAIVHPTGENFGSIELLGYNGDFERRDFSAQAAPPALGNLMLRFFVDDLEKYLAKIGENGVTPLRPLSRYELSPYGPVEAVVIESPDGVWLEFISISA